MWAFDFYIYAEAFSFLTVHSSGFSYTFSTFSNQNLGLVVQNLTKLLFKMTLKFLSWNMANTLIIFAEKMWIAFATHILAAKISMYLKKP